MSDAFVGEIQIFGFAYAPFQWASCNGALLPIRQNAALFSLIGTSYGGDGKITFALPNLAGRAACSMGQGPGLSPRDLGQAFGANAVSLDAGSMPAHAHAFTIYNQPDVSKKTAVPATGSAVTSPGGGAAFIAGASPDATFNAAMIGPAGGGQPHENRQPFLALNFCIALQGEYPSFS